MAERFPLWLQTGSHPAENDRLLISALVAGRSGVVDHPIGSFDFQASGVPDMQVHIYPGLAFIEGTTSTYQGVYQAALDAAKSLTVTTSDPSLPRRDLVVGVISDSSYAGVEDGFEVKIIDGTPATTPELPTLPDNAISICEISVAAGATSIAQGDLIDARAWIYVDGTPPGSIQAYAGSASPRGWLLCDGAAVSTTTYPRLFDAIGYTYGGSGSTFNLPDLRDRFPVGAGSGYALNDQGGADSVTLTEAQIPSHDHGSGTLAADPHTHTYEQSQEQSTSQPSDAGSGLVMDSEMNFTANTGSTGADVVGFTSSTGGDGSHENRPPYIGLNFIIHV